MTPRAHRLDRLRTARPTTRRGSHRTAFAGLALAASLAVPAAARAQSVAVPAPDGMTVPVQYQTVRVATPAPLASPGVPTPRASPWWTLASARVAVGPVFALGAAGRDGTGFATDVGVGVRAFEGANGATGAVLGLELGYSWQSNLAQGLNAGRLGLAVGLRHTDTVVTWMPQLVVGAGGDGALAVGVRNGVFVGTLGGFLGVELAHQYLATADTDAHSLQAMASLDVGLLAHMVSIAVRGHR